MIISYLYLAAGIFVYFQIGYRLAQISWWTWTNAGKAPRVLQLILFPVQFLSGTVGTAKAEESDVPDIWIRTKGYRAEEIQKLRYEYEARLAFAWPVKIFFNTALVGLAACYVVIDRGFRCLLYGPDWIAKKMLARAPVWFGRFRRFRKTDRAKINNGAVGGTLPVAVPTAGHDDESLTESK